MAGVPYVWGVVTYLAMGYGIGFRLTNWFGMELAFCLDVTSDGLSRMMTDTGVTPTSPHETRTDQPAGSSAFDPQPESRTARLLLIDDAAPLRQAFASILRKAGFLVVEASGGHDGLRQLHEGPLDLVLTDLDMPDLSGWEVAREVRRLHPDLPVVLVTGNPGALEVDPGLRGLVRAILMKPLGARQLLDVVGRLTAERPAHRTRFTMQTGRQLSVLLVEDNDGDARLIQECLRGNPIARIVWADTLAAALPHLEQQDLDLVLLDLGLPDSQGVDTVTRVVRAHPALPVIVVTGREDNGLALAALTAGAEDYLVKGAIEPDALVRAIQYAYERKRAEVAQREAHEFTNQIVHHIQEGVVVYDRGLRHRIWNPFLEALSGLPAARVVGRHIDEISPLMDAPILVNALHQALDGEVITLPEILYRVAATGRERWISPTFGPLRDAQGETIGVIANVRDITARKEAEDSLRSLSTTDEITGLHNRRGFLTLAPQCLKQADRNRESALLVFADLDGLKTINDTWGHRAGDQALRDVADVLERTFRASDILARLGGDEFAVLVPETPLARKENVLTRLYQRLGAHNSSSAIPLSLSLGVACYDWEHPCALEDLLAQADAAMYEQKREKKAPGAPVLQ